MADATVRVSGPVINVDTRKGVSKAGNPYVMTTARVLVEETGVADVLLPDGLSNVARGDLVDLLCDVSVFGSKAQLAAIRDIAA